MDASQDFKSLQDKIQRALVTTTKSANGLAGEDLSFLRTVDPAVASKLDDNTARLLRLSEELLKSAGKFVGQQAPSIEDADDIDISWRGVLDVIDTLLEKADTCLDEYTGLIKRKDAPTPEAVSRPSIPTVAVRAQLTQFQGRVSKKPKPTSQLEWSMKRANIIKPQNAFERKVDNFDTGPWKPLLTTKPHATLPLDASLTTYVDGDDTQQYDYTSFLPLSVYSKTYMRQCVAEKVPLEKRQKKQNQKSGHRHETNSKLRYKHPYETEILNLSYPKRIYETKDAIPYLPFDSTTATWVDTYEGVLEMLKELKSAKEIAVDLEHHDFRTYPGLTSLMQISTREKDWVIDTLRPWRHKLEVLNEVFADPKIIKVRDMALSRFSSTNIT